MTIKLPGSFATKDIHPSTEISLFISEWLIKLKKGWILLKTNQAEYHRSTKYPIFYQENNEESFTYGEKTNSISKSNHWDNIIIIVLIIS